MSNSREDALPAASPSDDRYAMERIGPVWREMSSEEWVARNIHHFPLWGWADFRFSDPEFDAWMREAERYVYDFRGRRTLREKYLTPEEIAEAEDYESSPP